MKAFLRALGRALFLDVPFLIDSVCRRIDFNLNCEFRYRSAANPAAAMAGRRPSWQRPVFWFFALTVVFIGYGPVWDGLCTVFVPPTSRWVLVAAAVVVALATARLALTMYRGMQRRIASRFDPPAVLDDDAASIGWRRAIAWLTLLAMIVVVVGVLLAAAYLLYALASGSPGPCSWVTSFSYLSLARLGLCAAAIVAFAIALEREGSTRRLAWIQFALLAAVALVHWMLSGDSTEASGRPYRHVFALVAPALCLAVALAPAIARYKFSARAGFHADTGTHFAGQLPRSELFDPRGADPLLTLDRVVYALVRGTVYRPLQLLLAPALLAFVARPDWLAWMVLAGFVFSLLTLAWGSIANRWQQTVILIERWFLRGTSLPVSLFVIVIAALRVFGVDYVTTIIDAAPFGVLFGVVLMSYVLSWLIEYWINRAVGFELLRMLGHQGDAAWMPYAITIPADPDVHVELPGRYLATHAIGRFLAVGTLTGGAASAFHSYDLLGFFTRLARRDDANVAEVSRHTNFYFYIVNALLVIVLALFGAFYVFYLGGLNVDAVVATDLAPPARSDAAAPAVAAPAPQAAASQPTGLKDLAALLVAPAGTKPRPAIVVVASGGGTRAAVYTAHVLEGLHRLGVDQDIVLMSGVSGGGVALTFFAANFNALTGKAAPATTKAWNDFKFNVSDQFIQDVLEGATEWRVFGATPLTNLLAESFDRRLPAPKNSRFRFADLSAPPLILNTTIVGHPADDSDLLRRTLDPASDDAQKRCRDEERPYTLMKGGRLIFTNLKEVSEFPQRNSAVPDTRLPYRIVQDPAVPLGAAAALHANFPPVFPNARVVFTSYQPGSACPQRSYFVTDGGAEENLGLVSALYAVKSALAQIEQTCPARTAPAAEPKRKCELALRPIHFVLAEASATGYDFAQDRGLSAAISGAKERMTGGLTEELIKSSRALHADIAGSGSGAQPGVRFHYLALPLLFRARGGFGTHWMQAETIKVADPRRRDVPPWWRGLAGFGAGTVTLNKEQVGTLWTALHPAGDSFCSDAALAGLKGNATSHTSPETVWEWICRDGQGKPGPRDMHIEEWTKLVEQLRP